MRDGKLLTQRGKVFKSTADYVKISKAFWHWYQKINRKNGVFIDDITEDLDAKYDEKPTWVYLKDGQMDELIKKCRGYYRPLISFLFDSGARPTEAFSLLVEDISQDAKGTIFANIRNEISKGGGCGRKIKLLLSGKEILKYIKINGLKPSDQLFFQSNTVVNRYISSLAVELFGDQNSEAGNNYKNLSLYDFRHNSCCYWLQRYKNNANLMYRFGWKTEKYIHYYSEFLGLKDQISEEDLFVDITKTELEKELKKVKKDLNERMTKEDVMGLFSEVMKKAGVESLKEMEKIHKRNLEKSKTALDVLNA